MSDAIKLTWHDIHAAVDGLVARIKFKGWKPLVIVGIARGGLIPATFLSHRLGIRDIRLVQCSKYKDDVDHNKQDLPTIKNVPDLPERGSRCLFVDDVVESCSTFYVCSDRWPLARQATLFMKKDHRDAEKLYPNMIWAQCYPPDRWLQFPWE